MSDKAAKAISMARTQLVLDQPWWGTLALNLCPQERKGTGRFQTNGTSFFYDPARVEEADDLDLQFRWAATVFKCAMKHPYRIGNRDLAMWNEASSQVTHLELSQSGFTLPSDCPADMRYKGKSVEEVYAQMLKEKDDQGKGKGKDDGGGQPGGGSSPPPPGGKPEKSDGKGDKSKDKPEPSVEILPPKKAEPDDDPQDSDDDEDGDDGDDGQGDNEGDDEQEDGDGQGPGEDEPEPKTESDWEIAVEQATAVAKKAGQLPANMDRCVKAAKEERVDWKTVLRQFLINTQPCDYSWQKPNRRFISMGMYLPGVRKENMPPFAMGNDTSGSVSNRYQALVGAESTKIMRELLPEFVDVYHGDTRVASIDHLDPNDGEVKLHAKGGGGTDFNPIFEAIMQANEKNESKYAAIVFFSEDLQCYPQIPNDPGIPVLWLVPETVEIKMPFGETIKVSDY